MASGAGATITLFSARHYFTQCILSSLYGSGHFGLLIVLAGVTSYTACSSIHHSNVYGTYTHTHTSTITATSYGYCMIWIAVGAYMTHSVRKVCFIFTNKNLRFESLLFLPFSFFAAFRYYYLKIYAFITHAMMR